MFSQLRTSVSLLVVMTFLTGVVYPGVVTIIAQLAFPEKAVGSLLRRQGDLIGSELVGQPFSRPDYFWGRLSATGPFPYNAAASSGSNFGPLHPGLKEAAEARITALQSTVSLGKAVPVDLVTASGSGLDPHISPAAAEFQAPRIAAARGVSESAVRELIQRHTEDRQLGVLGEPRVNVLKLNLDLDRQYVK